MAKVEAILTEDDWIALRPASIASRGLLLDILHLMGATANDGRLHLEKQIICRFVGLSEPEFDMLLEELCCAGILMIDNGVVVSPRLARRAEISETRARCGRMGGRPSRKAT